MLGRSHKQMQKSPMKEFVRLWGIKMWIWNISLKKFYNKEPMYSLLSRMKFDLRIKSCWNMNPRWTYWFWGSFTLGDDDDDKVNFTTLSWNGYSTQCMMTSSYCNLSSSSSANSYTGINATHSWRQKEIKSSSPSANEPLRLGEYNLFC